MSKYDNRPFTMGALAGAKTLISGIGDYMSMPRTSTRLSTRGRFGYQDKARRNFKYIATPSKSLKYYDPSALKEEKKWITSLQSTPSNIPVAGFSTIINLVPQGVGVNERIGQSIALRDIQIRLKLRRNGDGSNDTVRIMVIYVKESAITAAGIFSYALQNYNSLATDDTNINSPLELKNTHNFRVLKDVIQELDSGHGEEYYWQYYHKCALKTQYAGNATPTTGGDFRTGAVFLVLLNVTAAHPATYSYISRIRFTDD